jgi:uncharacterized protein (TIGR03083 family)
MATRDEIISRMRELREEIEQLAHSATAEAWAHGSYEGWTARDLLSHIASTSAPASFLLLMAQSGGTSGMGGGDFDQDAFNAQQVAMRAERSVEDVVDEIRANIQRDTQSVDRADQALLEKHYVAPWGTEGTLAEVILASLNEHLGMHVSDLTRALAA